jgi:DNA-binding GntR family transcriptional regulator
MNDDAAREAAFARAYRMIRTTVEQRAEAGQRLLVGVFTRATGLSPTPVREALSRLVGEGLIEEHRGGGYYVPRLDARDVAELYALGRALALAAITERQSGRGMHRTRRLAASLAEPPLEAEAQAAYWFERLAVASGSLLLANEMRRLSGRMAGIRRAEIVVMTDLATRLEAIAVMVERDDAGGLIGWIEEYCREGQEKAGEIADWLTS